MESAAIISECGTYRYSLTRKWGPGKTLVFVMLNPSTADASVDDPTIRRCIGFAKNYGYDAIEVVNVFALRATDPKELYSHLDPIGPENDKYIVKATEGVDNTTILAWGTHMDNFDGRVSRILVLLGTKPVFCLGTTKSGQPRHPLYLSAKTTIQTWPQAICSPIKTKITLV